MTINSGIQNNENKRGERNTNGQGIVGILQLNALPARRVASRFSGVVATVVTVTSFVLGLRFVTNLLGSDPSNYIQRLSQPLITPFQGLSSATSRFDFTALVAIFLYCVVGWVLVALFDPVIND